MNVIIGKYRPQLIGERIPVIWPLMVVIAAISVGILFSPYKGAATAAYLFLLIGLIHKHRRKVHVTLMSIGMICDLCLVLTLEFQRSAIGTATGGRLNFLQGSHVAFSTLAVVFYIPVAVLGYRRYKNQLQEFGNKSHRNLGIFAFLLRTIGFLLMFSMTGNYS